MKTLARIFAQFSSSTGASQVVPPTGHTAWLTSFSALAMAFLAVFALALAFAAERLSERWGSELARTATVRISAPIGQERAQVAAALNVLQTTPGVENARLLDQAEERALLEPWFGSDIPLDALPVPKLIEVQQTQEGIDAQSLRLRLSAEAPAAVLDDHTRWREPLVEAASALSRLALVCIAMIAITLAAIVTLAASASLSANSQVIRVLRLIGARDSYIAKAFVRRFTLRAAAGSVFGTAIGMLGVFLIPSVPVQGGFLTGIGFVGWEWFLPVLVPLVSGIVAYVATRAAAFRTLRGMT